MAPLNNRVIPDGWREHHRPVAESSMTGLVDVFDRSILKEPKDPLGDPEAPKVGHGIPCRIQQIDRPSNTVVAGQEIATRQYRVVVPSNSGIEWRPGSRGTFLKVVGVAPDADRSAIMGMILELREVLRGTETWEQDLVCVENPNPERKV